VLGKTGRNFAAGMSGGIAYVLDEAGDFERRCNTEMVELERIRSAPLAAEDWVSLPVADVMGDMLADDARRLRALVERHRRFTGSAVAARVLDRWDELLPKFVKIVPTDYRRALVAMRAEAEAGAKTAAAE